MLNRKKLNSSSPRRLHGLVMEALNACPVCGEKMEEGTLRAIGEAISIHWGPPNWGIFSGRGERIGGGFIKVDLIGSRCPKCKIIIINYGEKKEE